MSFESFLNGLDFGELPNMETMKKIYAYDIGESGCAEKVLQRYEDAGFCFIWMYYDSFVAQQEEQEHKTALEVAEWYAGEQEKRKEVKKRWIEKRTQELTRNC